LHSIVTTQPMILHTGHTILKKASKPSLAVTLNSLETMPKANL
jgi:hypothetical protein